MVLAILAIHARIQEQFKEVSVQVLVFHHKAHDLDAFRERFSRFIGAIGGRQCFEYISNGHHLSLGGHVVADELPRIARPIHFLVVPASDFRNTGEMPGPRDGFQHDRRLYDMVVNDETLFLG